jgi:hypothetical protein
MTNRLSISPVLLTAVLLGCAALILHPKVKAAEEGKISGTVKLAGAAPHMRGIDMSKDPFCSKAHASDPARLENVVVGQGGGLENVVLYISEGRRAEPSVHTQSRLAEFFEEPRADLESVALS